MSDNIIIWNVRGLKGKARRDSIREFILQEHASLVCLQETKLHVVSNRAANELLGLMFDYVYLPSSGLARGILLAWRTNT